MSGWKNAGARLCFLARRSHRRRQLRIGRPDASANGFPPLPKQRGSTVRAKPVHAAQRTDCCYTLEGPTLINVQVIREDLSPGNAPGSGRSTLASLASSGTRWSATPALLPGTPTHPGSHQPVGGLPAIKSARLSCGGAFTSVATAAQPIASKVDRHPGLLPRPFTSTASCGTPAKQGSTVRAKPGWVHTPACSHLLHRSWLTTPTRHWVGGRVPFTA
jgi:hypothetical protein